MVPKAEHAQFYDDKFKAIQENPKLLAIYDELKDIIQGARAMLPQYVQHDIAQNFLPVVRRHLVADIANTKEWIHTMPQQIIDSLTATGDEVSGQDRLPIKFVYKGESVKSTDLSHDLVRITELFGIMALHYKHFSKVKDAVEMGETIIKEEDRLRRAGVNPGEALENTLKSLKYMKEYVMYKKPRALEGATKATIYSINPLKQRKIAARVKELQAMKHDLEQKRINNPEEMTFEQYSQELKKLDDEMQTYEGQNIYMSKVGDRLIGINQLKALSYNPFSGFANLAFGVISMYTYANGNTDFTTKEAHQAMGIMRHSTKRWVSFGKVTDSTSKKILAVVEKFGTMADIVDSQYGESNIPGRKSRVRKALNPFELLRSSDYFMKGSITVAMLLHKKMKFTVDGTETEMSMWEALDEEGNFKYPVGEEWQSEDVSKETEWAKFRNKMIRVNQIIMGNMDRNSPKLLNKSVIGRLVGQFRASWLPEGWAARFEDKKYDVQLERWIKGRYRTAMDLGLGAYISINLKQLASWFVSIDPFTGARIDGKPLEAVDIENMRKNFTGLMFTLSSMAAIMMLKYLFLDDDDKKDGAFSTLMITMNLMNRVNQDLQFYSSPDVANTIVRNVVPAMDVINDYNRARKAFVKAVMEEDYTWDEAAMKFTKATPYLNLINKFNYMTSRDISDMSR
jgi:hypothetical protein